MAGPPSSPTPAPPVRPAVVTLASVLCWVVGLVTVAWSVVNGIPAISAGGSVILLAANVAAGVAVCVAAVLVYRQRKIGALLVVLGWGFPQVAAVAMGQPVHAGPVLLLIAMVAVFSNWKYMH